ncbi:hypothetical protein ASC77_21130 [Nocardioides sp. Root1257]|uniref:hypothetical protein n=1 Tax=unclassified Nocardioides TaxID=2615069 RepID=UPI0006FDA785|nr:MULTISPECIES: hypothetical protein [unclassified Nocardioides]KQW43905.1 hypothetical protein ASC77_21130 [Nocardioides sp. Root1257]KRC42346.1 hypothetical protein ASE24_20925 [Nocardioides sp. Root224]
MTFLQQLVHQLLAGLLALAPGQPAGASAVLHDWDDRRAAAWAAGDPVALGSLYAARASAGRADVAMLRAWRARGLRVRGMRMQLLDLEVRRATATRLDLVVTDRLAGAVARGPGVRLPLPEAGASTRRVLLVRSGSTWRVAQASAVRTTSWTVRSRKE